MKKIAVAVLVVVATATSALAGGWQSEMNRQAAVTYCQKFAEAYAAARKNFDFGTPPERNISVIATSYQMDQQEAYTVVSAAFNDKKAGGSIVKDKNTMYNKCISLAPN